MVPAQSDQFRYRSWRAGGWISCRSIYPGQGLRSAAAHERRPHREGEVCSLDLYAYARVEIDANWTPASLRRRFEQNQEDCTFTVLAILPTATENILEALPVEQTLSELQKQKVERLSRSVGPSEIATSDVQSAPPSVTDDDGKSLTSFQSESYVHASQIGDSSSGNGEGGGDGVPQASQRQKKTKSQLWNEMKISCKCSKIFHSTKTDLGSNCEGLYFELHSIPTHTPHSNTTQPSRPSQLPRKRCLASFTTYT